MYSLYDCTADHTSSLKWTQLFSDSSDTDTTGSEHTHKPHEDGIKAINWVTQAELAQCREHWSHILHGVGILRLGKKPAEVTRKTQSTVSVVCTQTCSEIKMCFKV